MKIETPYLLFLGSATDHLTVKIANSIVDWRPDLCVGETALPDCTITKGLPRLWPAEAREHGARTLVVCANNEGGHFEPEWIPVIVEALEAGLDVDDLIAVGLEGQFLTVQVRVKHARGAHVLCLGDESRAQGAAGPIAVEYHQVDSAGTIVDDTRFGEHAQGVSYVDSRS